MTTDFSDAEYSVPECSPSHDYVLGAGASYDEEFTALARVSGNQPAI
jgi:hypothetical protein